MGMTPNSAQAIAHPQLTLKTIPAGPCTGLFWSMLSPCHFLIITRRQWLIVVMSCNG